MEEKQLFGCLTAYRERAFYLKRLEQYEKAKLAYDEVLKSHPEDTRTLLGRSETCAATVQPRLAYHAAELALKLQPSNMNALNMQARALYTMTDFEKSLIMNHRGHLKRRLPQYFKEGIDTAKQTINDCIGKQLGQVLEGLRPFMEKSVSNICTGSDYEPCKIEHVSPLSKPPKSFKKTQLEVKRDALLHTVLARKYLGQMAEDKFFLQKLKNSLALDSANVAGSKQLREIINSSYDLLVERQEMLRAQRPYYSIQKSEKTDSRRLSEFKEKLLENKIIFNTNASCKLIRQVDLAAAERNLSKVMLFAERLQRHLDNVTEKTLPDKTDFMNRLYKTVGEAYLDQHRLSYSLSDRSNRRRVSFLMGLPLCRPSSYDSVIGNFPYKYGDINQITDKVAKTLEICENSMMRCFLLYEISRLLCMQKNYSLAKYYAKLCQKQAQKVDSVTWWLNGLLATMSCDIQQGNSTDVRILVKEALQWVNRINNADELRSFLLKCEEMAMRTTATIDNKEFKQRERDILKVLDPPQREEYEVFLNRRSNLPTARQVPVFAYKSNPKLIGRHKYRQKGLSVVPGQPKPLYRPPKSKVLGYTNFEEK